MSTPPRQPEHLEYMRRALVLARRGQGRVEPNPMVGCVLVKGNRIIAEGYHTRFGAAHAEVAALKRCGRAARGTTAYVTLEPCNHFGKTPPCTAALRQACVGRVVSAMRDPNPEVAGRGIRALKQGGIEVVEGILRAEAEQLNAPYLKLQATGMPFVIAKWAQSIDGKIDSDRRESRWISSPASRKLVHRLRSRMDAIVVGSNTVLRDDPQLTCRGLPARRVAHRVVLDTRLRIPPSCRVVRSARRTPTLVFTSAAARFGVKARRLELAGVRVLSASLRGGHVSLKAVLRRLGGMGMTNILLEGGGQVLSSAFAATLIDEVFVFVAPTLIGGIGVPCALMTKLPPAARQFRNLTTRRVGRDLLYHFTL